MTVDYKISRIAEDGKENLAKVVFYSGDISEKEELDEEGVKHLVTRYRRNGKLEEKIVNFLPTVSIPEVKLALNEELKEKGTPIKEQNETAIKP